MKAPTSQQNHRAVFSVLSGALGLSIILSTLEPNFYSSPALIVFLGTALFMWGTLLSFLPRFADMIAARYASLAFICAITLTICLLQEQSEINGTTCIALAFSLVIVSVGAIQAEKIFSIISFISSLASITIGLTFSGILTSQPMGTIGLVLLIAVTYTLIHSVHRPIAMSLKEAQERAATFSTITKSSREFHSREPEEAMRNIVNVTKALGYVSVSVVSFDRRQKVFEDGVPIPNAVEVALRASTTRRVTIAEGNQNAKHSRSRVGDVIGVPIWINGRYSAALIVQTSPLVKITQRDSEALELLADQAGRALENAGKAAMDRRVVERLTDESQRDKLTGLGNRRFADIMVSSIKVGDVLAIIDLDGLKNTNDAFGHSSGDELLQEVGMFLNDKVRSPDMAARLGGDEFMVLLRNAGDGAGAILERLLRTWESKKLFNTTFSIGMAVHRVDKTARETVEAADSALYQAKKEGKNRLVAAAS